MLYISWSVSVPCLIATMNIFLYNHFKSPLHNLGLPRIRYSFLKLKIIFAYPV
nr:MAG TPA: hypothetical protein [Caudoviricetes sp.]